MPPLRVLMVEDNEDDTTLVVRELRQGGYDVAWQRVERREQMVAALDDETWDLVICDFRMPRFSAPDALTLCRERGVEAPFIIVSGTVGEEEAVESMRAGAHDFVTKGKFARLCPAVARGLREVEERRARMRAEAQLQQAQKMEAVGQLAGGVAHDFNNILGVAIAHCELLLRELDPDDPRRDRVEQVLEAAERGADLNRRLLAFGRRQVFQPRVLSLNAVVSSVERMLRRLIPEDVQIVTALDDRLRNVKADPVQSEQVIMNLALNARDAMPQGGTLLIETANVELDGTHTRAPAGARPGPHVVLTVSDTGHGMNAQTLGHVFEPFFTTKAPGKGTGLGLATVYGIVQQAGGHLSVESEAGRGSTFRVYLPRCDEEEPTASARTPEETLPGSETILLLEDEPALRAVIQEVLEAAGYTVVTGDTPEEAMRAGLAHPRAVDLLVTDVVMPGLGGPEAARRLRAVHRRAKVLYISGYTREALGHEGVLDAETHFLQKPFATYALLRRVRDVLATPG